MKPTQQIIVPMYELVFWMYESEKKAPVIND